MLTDSLEWADYVIVPVKNVFKQRLVSVNYQIQREELNDFDVSAPNQTGCLSVTLSFETGLLFVFSGWNKNLRGEDCHSHIQFSAVQQTSDRLHTVDVSNTDLWKNLISKPLNLVEIYGFGNSPQAIALKYLTETVFISTGYSGTDLVVGDGDELLVFDEAQWRTIAIPGRIIGHSWSKLWDIH